LRGSSKPQEKKLSLFSFQLTISEIIFPFFISFIIILYYGFNYSGIYSCQDIFAIFLYKFIKEEGNKFEGKFKVNWWS